MCCDIYVVLPGIKMESRFDVMKMLVGMVGSKGRSPRRPVVEARDGLEHGRLGVVDILRWCREDR